MIRILRKSRRDGILVAPDDNRGIKNEHPAYPEISFLSQDKKEISGNDGRLIAIPPIIIGGYQHNTPTGLNKFNWKDIYFLLGFEIFTTFAISKSVIELLNLEGFRNLEGLQNINVHQRKRIALLIILLLNKFIKMEKISFRFQISDFRLRNKVFSVRNFIPRERNISVSVQNTNVRVRNISAIVQNIAAIGRNISAIIKNTMERVRNISVIVQNTMERVRNIAVSVHNTMERMRNISVSVHNTKYEIRNMKHREHNLIGNINNNGY